MYFPLQFAPSPRKSLVATQTHTTLHHTTVHLFVQLVVWVGGWMSVRCVYSKPLRDSRHGGRLDLQVDLQCVVTVHGFSQSEFIHYINDDRRQLLDTLENRWMLAYTERTFRLILCVLHLTTLDRKCT